MSLPASVGYAPWTPPFRYDEIGNWVVDSKGNPIADVRGWGFLTGKCDRGLGLPQGEAERIQNEVGERIANLLNEHAYFLEAYEGA